MKDLVTQISMMPYHFSADHVNYVRLAPVYVLQMMHLPSDIIKAFNEGHTCRRSPGAFKLVWSDMGTESTVMRDTKEMVESLV